MATGVIDPIAWFDAELVTIRGAAVATGGLINDATRAADVDGDGFSIPDSSFGIWLASQNLLTNGNADSNTTGWSLASSATVARIVDAVGAKFGSTYLQGTITTTAGSRIYQSSGLITGAIGEKWTASCWVKAATSGDVGKVVTLASWTLNLSSGAYQDNGSVDIILTANWVRYQTTVTATTTTESVRWELGAYQGNSYPAASFFVAGAQMERLQLATPYIDSNGTQPSRTAGSVKVPPNLLNLVQSWIGFRVRIGASDSTSTRGLFYLGDVAGNNNMQCYYDPSNVRFAAVQNNGGSGGAIVVAAPNHIGDLHTVIVKWDATSFNLSVDGSPFSSVGGSRTPPSVTPVGFDLGSLLTWLGNTQLLGEMLWAVGGVGVLSDQDAITINAYGNADPYYVPASSAPAFVWPADTLTYVTPQTSYIEGATIASKTTPSISDIYTPGGTAYTESATVASKTTVTAVEAAQDVDSATVASVTAPTIVETEQSVESATVTGKTTPSIVDVYTPLGGINYTESATISSVTTVISVELRNAQTLLPISDVLSGGWLPGNSIPPLYDKIDETVPDDITSFIYAFCT